MIRRILAAVLALSLIGAPALAQDIVVPSVIGAIPVTVAQGGTNCILASVTCFNNITGFTAAGTTGTPSTNLVFSASPTGTGTWALPIVQATSVAAAGCTISTHGLCNTGTSVLTGNVGIGGNAGSANIRLTLGAGGTGTTTAEYLRFNMGSGAGSYGGFQFTLNGTQKGLIYYDQVSDATIFASSGLDPAIILKPAGNLQANMPLLFSGATSSFPSIKRSAATLAFRLADDSADAAFSASTGTLSAVATVSSTQNALCITSGGVMQQQATSCVVSARRFKKDIAPLAHGLDWVSRMQPVTYGYKADKSVSLGLIADDLAQIDERLAARNEKGEVQTARYDLVAAVLVKAVQEQQAQITKLQAANDNLEARVAKLEAR